MNTDKINRLLQKIQALMPSEEEGFSALEKDLLLAKIRNLYDLILDISPTNEEARETSTHKEVTSYMDMQRAERRPFFGSVKEDGGMNLKGSSKPASEVAGQRVKTSVGNKENNTGDQVPVKPQARFTSAPWRKLEKRGEQDQQRESTSTEAMQSSTTMEEEGASYQRTGTITPTGSVLQKPAPNTNPYVNQRSQDTDALFETGEARDLSERLGGASVSDIYHAYTIHEKIHHIQELFGGNQEIFNSTISRLNSLNDMDSARKFLESRIIRQNKWLEDDKIDIARQFIYKVKRRFQ